MRTKLTVAAALGGTLLATCLVSGSAHAASVPVLKSDAGIVTLVGRGGGRGGGGGGMSRGGGGGGHAMRGGGGGGRSAYSGGGGGRYAYGGGRGGGSNAYRSYGGKKHYGGGGDRNRYAYKGDKRYYDGRYRRYGSYGWYGAPFLAYGAYAGSCGWLYRNAVTTGSPYWWNRYYECTGYY
jgi:hypothetical protein